MSTKKSEVEAAEAKLAEAHAAQAKAEGKLKTIRAEREAELQAGNVTKARELRHAEAELEADLDDAARVCKHAESHLASARDAKAKADREKLETRLLELDAKSETATDAIIRSLDDLAAKVNEARGIEASIHDARNALSGASARHEDAAASLVLGRLVELGIIDARELRGSLQALQASDPQAQAERARQEALSQRVRVLADAVRAVVSAPRERGILERKLEGAVGRGSSNAQSYREELSHLEGRVRWAEGIIAADPDGPTRLAEAQRREAA